MIFELAGSRLRVMGTLHLLPSGRQLPAWVRAAYDWSEAVFIEHSPSEFLARAWLPPDAPPGRCCSPAFLTLLREAAGGTPAVPLEGLQRGAAVLLALASRASAQAVPGADQALHDWSRADGKPFGYLEEAGQLLQLLDAIDERDWTPAIQAEIAQPQGAADQLRLMHELWRKSRLEKLAALTERGLFSSAAIRTRLLTGRNRTWAAGYTDPPRRSLVAVGAAHLVGPDSFLQMLAAASGRSVRRIA